MTQAEMKRVKETLALLAARDGCSVAYIRNAIQASIDDAWSRAWAQGNLQAQAYWQQLFPNGMKPTVEEFIAAMARQVKENDEHQHMLS